MTEQRHCSVIIAVCNEEASVRPLLDQLRDVCAGLDVTVDYWFVDDGSTDGTRDSLRQLCLADERVHAILFSRNFGHHRALFAGIEHCSADLYLLMDGDLQDDPREIPRLLQELDRGHDIVLAVRQQRNESFPRLMAAKLFWSVVRRVSGLPVLENQAVFRIFNRKVRDAVLLLPESDKFLAGIFTWVGFRQGSIRVTQGKRLFGTTKYSVWKLFDTASWVLTAFSGRPLRAITFLGVGLCVLAFFLMLPMAIFMTSGDSAWSLSLPSMTLTVFVGGLLLIALGICSEYLARIVAISLRRPSYIIDEIIGHDDRWV